MNKLKSLLLTILMAGQMGCVTTKYSHVNVMEHKNYDISGKNVDKMWIDEASISEIKMKKVVLGEIKIDSINDEKGISRVECKKYLEKQIVETSQNYGILVNDSGSGKCRIDFIFTNMSPGNAASRVWAGEFGFGHANVEIQAIVKNPDGKRIVEISDSRNNSGSIGFRDTFGDVGPALVKELITQISNNIMKEIKLLIGN